MGVGLWLQLNISRKKEEYLPGRLGRDIAPFCKNNNYAEVFPSWTGCSLILAETVFVGKRDMGVIGPRFRERFDMRVKDSYWLRSSTRWLPGSRSFLVAVIQQQQALMVPCWVAGIPLTSCFPYPTALLQRQGMTGCRDMPTAPIELTWLPRVRMVKQLIDGSKS